jgi:hypothetical protein
MKHCKECDRPVFSNLYCKYHQYKRKMQGGDLFTRKVKPKKPIAPQSIKQKKIYKTYLERLKIFWEKSVEAKTNYCIFCGELMEHREDNHHLLGRGSIVLDEEWWSHAHRVCHSKYESWSVEKLMLEPWYNDWLERLRKKQESLYWKEKKKEQKNLKDLFAND